MKKIFRIISFSAVAVIMTALWNKGFVIPQDYLGVLRVVAVVGVIFYIIKPISKLILLPVNLLTMGLASSILCILLLHFANSRYGLVTIKPWDFPGISWNFIRIDKTHIGYIGNLVLSSVSVSSIIN